MLPELDDGVASAARRGGLSREALSRGFRRRHGLPPHATAMLVLALAAPGPRLTGELMARPSWVSWSGGLLGAVFVMAAILTVPRLGAASVLALVVVGQMLGALAFDQVGLLGLPQHSIGAARLAGAACLILGVVLVRR